MLVLNTNQSWWGWYKISNENILWAYPDFENSILLTFPFNHWDIFSNVWNETALDINWTKINRFCESIVAPQFFTIYKPMNLTSSNQLWYAPIINVNCWSANNTSTYTVRFWLPWQMKWWEIIWKQIITPELLTQPYPWSTWYKAVNYKIWLLHSDWTISYIWNHSWNVASTSNSISSYSWSELWLNSWTSLYRTNKLSSVIKTSWIVAQEWDYLIYEIELSRVSSASTTIYLYFGAPYPVDKAWIQYPIQVSID